MNFYEDLPKSFVRFGRTADRPATPPGKSAAFWDIQTGKLWAVNDAMEWVNINPDPTPPPPVYPFQAVSGIIATAAYPVGDLNVLPSGAFLSDIYIFVNQVWDTGTDVQIGDSGDADRYVTFGQVNLQEVGWYHIHPLYTFPADTQIQARLSQAAAFGGADIYFVYDERINA